MNRYIERGIFILSAANRHDVLSFSTGGGVMVRARCACMRNTI